MCQWSLSKSLICNKHKKNNSANSFFIVATSHQMIDILHFACGGEHKLMAATMFSATICQAEASRAYNGAHPYVREQEGQSIHNHTHQKCEK